MSKDKREIAILFKEERFIRIQNTIAFLFMCEGNQKVLLDMQNYRKYTIHMNFMKKTFLHYIFQSIDIEK